MRGDFLGFSFDGIHCSSLGITHVSSSDRYDENLSPEINDKTIEIPGNDGEYYFGSNFGTHEFHIDIAFDNVTETQFRKIRTLFNTKKICELIFDERPYKVYYAKLQSPIELSYICFDEPYKTVGEPRDGVRIEEREVDPETGAVTPVWEQVTPYEYDYSRKQRIYKGEGTIEFICYYPFAKQLFKILELYESGGNLLTTYTNVDEWAESSGILSQADYTGNHIDEVLPFNENSLYNYTIPVYNPGDLNVGFYLYLPFSNGEINPIDGSDYIIINADDTVMLLDPIVRHSNDNATGVIINTVNHLIEGVVYDSITELNDYRSMSWKTTGHIYNEYIYKGQFAKIKRNDWRLDDEHRPQAIYIGCAPSEEEENGEISIHYDYLYY